MDRAFGGAGGGRGSGTGAMWSPAIEVSERDGNYVIRAELPGLKSDEVNVQVADNDLLLRGERKLDHEEGPRRRPPDRASLWAVLSNHPVTRRRERRANTRQIRKRHSRDNGPHFWATGQPPPDSG